ncbi:MAG TPA: serine hydrolase domain-containing protein [Bryobacteraceae bacterium]
MRRDQIPNWLKLVLAAAGLVLLIPALWVLMSVTARPLYPDSQSVPTVMSSPPSSTWASAVERGRQIVRASVASQNLPGLSLAVGIDDELVWAEGFGFADLKTSEPVTPNHRFRLGTASTIFTSAAVGRLTESGRLKLDEQIQTYTPAFPQKQWPVTLRELMANTAGVVSDDDGGQLFTKHCETPADALPYFAEKPLLFQPGTRYRYSSYGWILVSAAVEAAAHEPFLRFVQERIFDPLGMRDTVPDSAPVTNDDFPPINLVRELIYDPQARRGAGRSSRKTDNVTPYFTRFASDPKYGMHVMRPLDYSCYTGASDFVSTPSDLVRFGMAVESLHGLGLYTTTLKIAGKQMRVIGQNGSSFGGMVASLLMIPEDNIVIAVTANISHADTFSIALKAVEPFVD